MLVQAAVAGQAGLPVHEDRVRGLVELLATGVGGGQTVLERVARHRAGGQLLALEQEARGRPGARAVAGEQEPGERLVEVASEHLAVGAEVGRLAVGRVAGRHGLPPRGGEAGGDRAGERLVHARPHDVDRAVVLARHGRAERGIRPAQAGVVALPARLVAGQHASEPGPDGPPGHRHRGPCALAEPEREHRRVRASERQLGSQRHMTVRGAVVAGQGVARVEHRLAVTGRAGVADALGTEAARALERLEGRNCVGAVDRIGDRVRVRGHGHGPPAPRYELSGVGACVLAPAAAGPSGQRVEPDVQAIAVGPGEGDPHEHGVGARVGQVGGGDAVAAGRVARRHRAAHAGRVGARLVAHVAPLHVRERAAVADQVLERVDVGRVDRRPVHVRQRAVGHGEPHLRAGAKGRADAVLAGEVEVALTPRGARRHRGRGRLRRRSDSERPRSDERRHRPTTEPRRTRRDAEHRALPLRCCAETSTGMPASRTNESGQRHLVRQRGVAVPTPRSRRSARSRRSVPRSAPHHPR